MDREKFKQLKQRAETVRRQPGFKAEPEPLPAERLPSLVPRLREEIHTYHTELEIQNQELIEAQAGMIANLEKYRGLFEHLPVPAVLLDARGFISAANRVARRWFGDDVASPQRHVPLLRLFHADSRSALHRYMQQMPHDVQGGELLRLAVASDEPVWVQIQAVFVPDEAAHPGGETARERAALSQPRRQCPGAGVGLRCGGRHALVQPAVVPVYRSADASGR